jgi:hypothetical protein
MHIFWKNKYLKMPFKLVNLLNQTINHAIMQMALGIE